MARVHVAKKTHIDGRMKVNLALTGITLSKHIVKRAILNRRRREVSCLRLCCSVRRYEHENQSKNLDKLQLSLLDYIAVIRR